MISALPRSAWPQVTRKTMSLGKPFDQPPGEFDDTPPRRQMPATRADQQLWADEGANPRIVEFKRHDLDFDNALDIEKIEAMLAWNDR